MLKKFSFHRKINLSLLSINFYSKIAINIIKIEKINRFNGFNLYLSSYKPRKKWQLLKLKVKIIQSNEKFFISKDKKFFKKKI